MWSVVIVHTLPKTMLHAYMHTCTQKYTHIENIIEKKRIHSP